MVSPPGKKKVSLKEYKKQEKDKKAAHQKAAANKTVDNSGSSKVADDVIPTLEQVELAMTEITITGPADTFIEQSKGAEVAISSLSEGTLEPPRAAVEVGNNPTTVPSDIELVEPSYGHLQESNIASASISLANESLEVSHAVVDVSEHVTVIHSPVDTAYQNALLNSERPEVIYDLDNYLTREFIETMLIENMDDARAMLARKARMDRMLEPRMYDLQVVKVGWAAEYEDVVGIPNAIRNWILQPVGHLVDSMNQLPDFTADISGQTSPVFYTPPSSSEGEIFPAASPEPSTHHGMHTPHTVDASVQASPIYTPGSSSNDSSVIVVLPVEGPATVSDEGQAASRLPVALPEPSTDRRVHIPKVVLSKLAEQRRVHPSNNRASSLGVYPSGSVSQLPHLPHGSYADVPSQDSSDVQHTNSPWRSYIPKALGKFFGQRPADEN